MTLDPEQTLLVYDDDMDPGELAYRISERAEHPVIRCVLEYPFEDTFYNPDNRPYSSFKNPITWVPPGHDYERPIRNNCGPIRMKGIGGDNGLYYTGCSNDREHYVKGKFNHCWSRQCSRCLNDTCLRIGTRIEERFTVYRLLKEKQGLDPGPLGHWVISPDQEHAKRQMQTHKGFTSMRKGIQDDLMSTGCLGGILMFHPWRQGDEYWDFEPHFHGLLYGFIDTDRFRVMNPGWIIKKIHSGQSLESIRNTAAYISTHEGIGIVTKDVEDVNYYERLLAKIYPGIQDGNYRKDNGETGPYGAATGRAFRYTDEDYANEILGKGRMVGDISWIDWLKFTMDPLYSMIGNNYFGQLSNRNIKIVATESYRVTRTCACCGGPLNVYTGMCDQCGEPATHIFNNTIHTFSADYPRVKPAIAELRRQIRGTGLKLGDITPKVALVVSMQEVMDNIAASKPKMSSHALQDPAEPHQVA